SIGICTVLPDRIPPEFFTVLLAAAPAPEVAARGAEGVRTLTLCRGAIACRRAASGARTLMGVLTLDGDAWFAAALPWACAGPEEVPKATAASAGTYPVPVSSSPPVATVKARLRLAMSYMEDLF